MADKTSKQSSSKGPPQDKNPVEEKETDKNSKVSVRRKKSKNIDYRSIDGGSKKVAPFKWDTKCSICEARFSRRDERDRHMREVHSRDGRVKCPDCYMTFSREEYMLRHRSNSHTSSHLHLKCEICETSFAHQRNLDRHKDEVHAGGHFKCKECPATYARKEKLQKHMEKGKHFVEFLCEICHTKLVFKDMKALEKHVKVKDGSRRKGYGIKLWCTSSSLGPWTIYGSKGPEEEKAEFIKRGLKKAQEEES